MARYFTHDGTPGPWSRGGGGLLMHTVGAQTLNRLALALRRGRALVVLGQPHVPEGALHRSEPGA